MPTRAASPVWRTTPATRLALLACLALGLGAGGLAGCGVLLPGRVTHYTPGPAAVQGAADCLATSSWHGPGMSPAPDVGATLGSVPPGFVPVDAVLCSPGPPTAQGSTGPPRQTILEQHLSGDYEPLLAALEEHSDRQEGGVCPAMAELIPDLWLVNAAGKAVHVQWPLTGCGFSKPGVRKALDALAVSSARTLNLPATGPGLPTPGPPVHYTPGPAALQAGVDCLASSMALPARDIPQPEVLDLMGSVPEGFVPVDVVECSLHVGAPAGTSAPTPVAPTIVERHFVGNYAPLLAALAQQSERRDGVVCEASLELIPDLWLVNAAGKAVHVQWPLDACNKSKPETAKALAGLQPGATRSLDVPAAR
ncbi:hypothetical protein [Specibacter sp. RAF43]|uniref:hypothetical protein n=1 Tax=Specibacter sp. RAF43 TaxID=3233057 RepID=UPI003F948C11